MRPLHDWSLRARLLATLLILLTAGLIAHTVTSYVGLKNHLMDNIDEQLGAFGHRAEQYATTLSPPGQSVRFGSEQDGRTFDDSLVSSGIFAIFMQVRDPGNSTVEQFTVTEKYGSPHITKDLPLGADGVEYFTVDGTESPWRVRASRIPGNRGYLVFAQPLTEVDDILDGVKKDGAIRVSIVIALISLTGWWLVRRGLRPLDAMGVTARAIGEGNLSERVEPANDRTEVGRLGSALNAMLHQLETAFTHRRESEQRLRQFVADASHELRTPLTSIRGYAEMFRRGVRPSSKDGQVAIRRIEEESARMAVLVDELLLLAHLDERRPLDMRPLDVVTLVNDAVTDARTADPARPIRFSAPPSVPVNGDEVRLRQVFANLFTNVQKHTPPESPVTVQILLDETAHTVRIEVSDTGPGLSAEQSKQVFERFYRVDKSRARNSGGAGLGLSIVASIVDAHGGTVGVESTPGQGATFWLELPLG